MGILGVTKSDHVWPWWLLNHFFLNISFPDYKFDMESPCTFCEMTSAVKVVYQEKIIHDPFQAVSDYKWEQPQLSHHPSWHRRYACIGMVRQIYAIEYTHGFVILCLAVWIHTVYSAILFRVVSLVLGQTCDHPSASEKTEDTCTVEMYNEIGKRLLKIHKFHHLPGPRPGTVFTKSCFSCARPPVLSEWVSD